MSDWKESANKRKDFRRSKLDPEISKKGRNKRKKKYKVVVKDHVWGWNFLSEISEVKRDYVVGKYFKKVAAEQALTHYKNNSLFKKFKIIIEEI